MHLYDYMYIYIYIKDKEKNRELLFYDKCIFLLIKQNYQ